MSLGQPNSETPNPAGPRRTRYRWLKRLLVAAAVLLVLIGYQVVSGCEAERRLQAKIAAYRAAGQPVEPEDFVLSPVPDDENAALDYEAAAKLTVDGKFTSDFDLVATAPQEAADFVAQNAEALELFRRARGKPQMDWRCPWTSPLINIVMPHLSGLRLLAKTACVAALSDFARNDHASCVERIRDILACTGKLHATSRTVVESMVATAIGSLASGAVERVAFALVVEGSPLATAEVPAPAQREQVRALIEELLDEQAERQGLQRAIYGERCMQLDTVRCLLAGRISGSALSGPAGQTGSPGASSWPAVWPVTAMLRADAVRMLDYMTAVADAARAPNWPQASGAMPALPSPVGLKRFAHIVSSMMLPSLERAVLIHFRSLAMRRMAATALALRLYELDHGCRPQTLNALVPEYLPAVPIDPFAADGRSIGYRPDRSPPLLYCVGVDGVDDQGEYELAPSGRVDQEKKDNPLFFLNGDRPREKSTSLPCSQPASQPRAADDDRADGSRV